MSDDLDVFKPREPKPEAAAAAAPTMRDVSDKVDAYDSDEASAEAALQAVLEEEAKNKPASVEAERTALVAAAKEAGMTDEEAASITDAASLAKIVGILQRKAVVERDDKAAKAATGSVTAPADAGEIPGFPELDAIADLNPDEMFDSEAGKAIKVLQKAVKDLRAAKAPATAAAPAVDAGSLDWLLSKHEDDLADVFGKGSAGELSENSRELSRRRQLVEEMDRITAKAKADKADAPSRKDAFQQALRALHGEKMASIERQATAAKVAVRAEQIVGRPSGTRSDLPNGRAKAIQTATRLMSKS